MTDKVDCFSAMHNCLHSFMKKGMFTDINFVIGESKIKAHKAILASCSPVFQTMFDTSMNEASYHEVVLTDVEEELFSAFLDYIYIRDVKIVEKHFQGMLRLADKYDIEPLALICDSYMEGSLTPENAVETLFLADLYRRDALKVQINQFIQQNLDAIMTYPSWGKLDEHFDLMNGIFQSIIKKESNEKQDEVTWSVVANKMNVESSWVGLIPRDFGASIVCKVMLSPSHAPREPSCFGVGHAPSYASNSPIICVNVENTLSESFPTTFVITISLKSVTLSRTTTFLSWAANSTGEAKLPVVYNLNHSLSLSCPFNVTVAVRKTEPINQHPYLKVVKEQMQRFSDAVIVAGNVKFPVHKLVLAGKSTFFSELFDKNQNEYRIEGMTERTFKSLLEYMYSNCNPEADQVDLHLLKGAERFQLNELTNYCFTSLQKNVTYVNAIEMCTKAEELQLIKFSSAVIEFMAKEPKSVASSLKWITMKNHPRVMKELLYKMKR